MKKCAVALYVIAAIIALLFEYHAYQPLTAKVGKLSVINWQQLPGVTVANVKTFGTGNSVRPVLFAQNIPCLEIASGNDGCVEYHLAVPMAIGEEVIWRLMFLSMQGTGRVELRGFDSFGKLLTTSGYTFSGTVASNAHSKMHSERSNYNFVGDWVEERKNIDEILHVDFAGDAAKITRLDLVLTVANGQHVLVQTFATAKDYPKSLVTHTTAKRLVKGEQLTVKIPVMNNGNQQLQDIKLSLTVPYGFGVIPIGDVPSISLNPGEEKTVDFVILAKRSSEVNFKRPWQMAILAEGQLVGRQQVDVIDIEPGQIFYVMTDDLEVIDAAGYPKSWGSRQAWITSEEIYVQMKAKAEKLNAIAEQYGALWTHYLALPILRAAQEMVIAGCDGWKAIVSAVNDSVRTQAEHGHEYGLHMHSDYDPLLPGNTLSINFTLGGFWANHLRHGWAHNVKPTGDYDDYSSRTGTLFSYLSELQELTQTAPLGTSLTSRVGSFDYGVGAVDQASSYAAYRKVGLFGSSDAPGNLGEYVSADYGKEIYFAAPEAIEKLALNLENIGLVEFLPTPKKRIEYDIDSLADLNRKVDSGVIAFSNNNKIKPGVHAIVGFTHAMFVMGDGDWKSTTGGAFAKIANHLEYVKDKYVRADIIEFATASQLVKNYLDYYTPQPVAITGTQLRSDAGCAEYRIAVLGKDIVANSQYPHLLTVQYPLWLRNSTYAAAICKNGIIIAYYECLPTNNNELKFIYNDNTAVYSMRLWHSENISKIVLLYREITESIAKIWYRDKKRQ